jgi:hypothetical protein
MPGFADGAVRILGVYECTGVVLHQDRWSVLGVGSAVVYEKGEAVRNWTAPVEEEAWP